MRKSVKKWLPEYRDVPRKRCMQADVIVHPDGSTEYPDTLRNQIRRAALEHLGRPISVRDIGDLLGVGYACANMRLCGARPWKDGELDAISEWLGIKLSDRGGM